MYFKNKSVFAFGSPQVQQRRVKAHLITHLIYINSTKLNSKYFINIVNVNCKCNAISSGLNTRSEKWMVAKPTSLEQ